MLVGGSWRRKRGAQVSTAAGLADGSSVGRCEADDGGANILLQKQNKLLQSYGRVASF